MPDETPDETIGDTAAEKAAAAERALRKQELDVKALEVRSQRLIDALKIVTTGVVVTLVPAIISWQLQNQQVEIERVKSEQSYLRDFAAEALQEDLHKRYNFADYLATVAHSDLSRNRWTAYRDKIKALFDEQERLRLTIIDLRRQIDAELGKEPGERDLQKVQQYRDDIGSHEASLKQVRDQFGLLNAPLIAPSAAVFTEPYGGGTGIRFRLRNLSLEEQGNALLLGQGGTINATVELEHDCFECGTAINQIVVGLAGAEAAQSCIWSGLQSSNGWQPASFDLAIPASAGTYEVRARYAQAMTCGDALGWWRVDRANGPGAGSTIGVVVVSDATHLSEQRPR